MGECVLAVGLMAAAPPGGIYVDSRFEELCVVLSAMELILAEWKGSVVDNIGGKYLEARSKLTMELLGKTGMGFRAAVIAGLRFKADDNNNLSKMEESVLVVGFMALTPPGGIYVDSRFEVLCVVLSAMELILADWNGSVVDIVGGKNLEARSKLTMELLGRTGLALGDTKISIKAGFA
jgi:hypothetical protein